jgi:hypothetical protein
LKNVNQILETVTQGHQNFLLDDVSDRSKALVTFSIVTPKPSAFDSDAEPEENPGFARFYRKRGYRDENRSLLSDRPKRPRTHRRPSLPDIQIQGPLFWKDRANRKVAVAAERVRRLRENLGLESSEQSN